MKIKSFFAFLILAALLVLPAFSAIVSLDSFKAESYDGSTPAGVFSTLMGNRTCSGVGGGCDANFTLFFNLANYRGTTITNFRVKHAFSIPSGSSGWAASGAHLNENYIRGQLERNSTYDHQARDRTYDATNSSSGLIMMSPADMAANKSYYDFNYSLPITQDILIITFAGASDAFTAVSTDNKGTAAFGKNWGILEFEQENVTEVLNITARPLDNILISAPRYIETYYDSYGCEPGLDYCCSGYVAFINGTVIIVEQNLNFSCAIGGYHAGWYVLPDIWANLSQPPPEGTYAIRAECDRDCNASRPVWSDIKYVTTYTNFTPATTTTVPGLGPDEFVHAADEAAAYWGPWIASHGSLLFGLAAAAIVLLIFLTLSGTFNLPILTTAGVIISAFIALVTLLLTSPYGLLILIVMVLLLLVIGAFAIFKGMSV